MNRSIAGAFVLLVAWAGPLVAADVVEKEVTEKTTVKTETYSGTVSEVNPSQSTIIVKSETSAKPMTYALTEKTTFVDEAGNVVARESIRNRPVIVYYTKEGDGMVVSKVVVTRPTGGVIQKRKETTERKEIETQGDED
jgi:hypothetical protein